MKPLRSPSRFPILALEGPTAVRCQDQVQRPGLPVPQPRKRQLLSAFDRPGDTQVRAPGRHKEENIVHYCASYVRPDFNSIADLIARMKRPCRRTGGRRGLRLRDRHRIAKCTFVVLRVPQLPLQPVRLAIARVVAIAWPASGTGWWL